MNGSKPGENLTKGFFKRIWNYLTSNYYQRKLNKTKYYDKNWDALKWKLRSGRLVYFLTLFLGSKYFLVDKVYSNVQESVDNKKYIFIDRIAKLDLNNNNSLENDLNNEKKNKKFKDFENEIFEKLNELNQGMFLIEEVSIEDSKMLNLSEKTYNKKTLCLKDLSDEEKYSILAEVNDLISKRFKETQNNSTDALNTKNKFLLYKVTNLLSKNQIKEETEEGKKFMRYF